MKLLTILSLGFPVIILFLRFIHVDVFNSLSLTFVHYSIIGIYADLFIHVTLDGLSGGFQVVVLLFTNSCEYSFTCLSITTTLEPFSFFRRLYTSMFNQLCIDLAIALREILFSSFWHS